MVWKESRLDGLRRRKEELRRDVRCWWKKGEEMVEKEEVEVEEVGKLRLIFEWVLGEGWMS